LFNFFKLDYLKLFLNKLFCYAIFYLVANIFGIYHQFLNSITQEDAYKNTIKFANARILLEKEKQQQV
jgi:hypothetical protein